MESSSTLPDVPFGASKMRVATFAAHSHALIGIIADGVRFHLGARAIMVSMPNASDHLAAHAANTDAAR